MQPRLSRTFGCKYKAAKHTLLDPVMSPRPPPPHSLRLEFPVDGPVQTPTYGKVTLKMCTTQRKRNCRIPTPTKGILMLYQSKLRSCSALCACFSFLVLNLGCCEEEKNTKSAQSHKNATNYISLTLSIPPECKIQLIQLIPN